MTMAVAGPAPPRPIAGGASCLEYQRQCHEWLEKRFERIEEIYREAKEDRGRDSEREGEARNSLSKKVEGLMLQLASFEAYRRGQQNGRAKKREEDPENVDYGGCRVPTTAPPPGININVSPGNTRAFIILVALTLLLIAGPRAWEFFAGGKPTGSAEISAPDYRRAPGRTGEHPLADSPRNGGS
jgi:hypothetical protein